MVFDPDQPSLAVQEVAFVVDHVRVVLAPEVIDVEDAKNRMVGCTGLATFTVTFCDTDVPLEPVQVSV